jgi:hypothetical protein
MQYQNNIQLFGTAFTKIKPKGKHLLISIIRKNPILIMKTDTRFWIPDSRNRIMAASAEASAKAGGKSNKNRNPAPI